MIRAAIIGCGKMSEEAGLSLMFAVLTDASARWHGVKIKAALLAPIKAINPSSKEEQVVAKAA